MFPMWVDNNFNRIVLVLTNCVLILITTEHSTKEQSGEDDKDNRHDDGVTVRAVDAERLRVRRVYGRSGTGRVAVQAGAARFTWL